MPQEPEGNSQYKTVHFPCSQEEFEEIADILTNLRDLAFEHLVVELEGYGHAMQFIQSIRVGEDLLIEIALDIGKKRPRIFQMADLEDAAAIDVYRQVCVEGVLPDLSGWEDITKEVFQSRWKKLFRKALRKVRKVFQR